MQRILNLKINPSKKGGLALSIKKTTVEGDDGNTEKHEIVESDSWISDAALKKAAGKAIDEYFVAMKEDGQQEIDQSPIGQAARE